MANISLDIKANTQKALGEFKKLSRELDNKFLVQGLKLDVVKSAFRDITKQFDAAVGEQGFKTAESGAQLRRSLALNLVTLKRFSGDVANAVSKDLQSSLRSLQAEGKIAGEAVKEALNAAAFFDFAGGEAERRAALKSFTNDFALFAQQTKNLFGSSDAGKIQRILTGQSNVDELFGLDFSAGGAVANRLNQLIRERVGGIANLSSIDPKRRSQIAAEIIKEFRNSPEYKIAQEEFQREQPFAALRLELQGLFSPEGAFGALRELPGELKEFGTDKSIPRTLLAATGKLLRTIFDREKGLFAILNNTLKEVFGGGFDVLNIIVSGAELLTTGLEKLGEFFQSASFKKFLNIFVPIQEAFDGISSEGFQFDRESINGFITTFFEALRNLIKYVSDYIANIDKAELGAILGNLVSQIGQTLASLVPLVFNVIGAAIQTISSDGLLTGLGIGAGALGITKLVSSINKLLGGDGLTDTILRSIRNRVRGGNGRDQVTGQRVTGFQSNVLRYLDLILRQLGGGTFFGPEEPPDTSGRRRRRRSDRSDRTRRGERVGRDGRTSRERARDMRNSRFRRQRNNFRSRTANLTNNLRSRFTEITRNRGRTAYSSPIGPLQANSVEPWARRGALDPIASKGGQLYTPRLESSVVRDRFFDARNAMSPYSSQQGFLRGGIGFNKGNALNRATIGTESADVASRFASRYGTRGILSRGAGRLGRLGGPVVGGLLTAFSLASLFGGSANASEMEGMTQEEKNEERRARDRQVIGGLAGIAGGAAGGALLGSAFGPVGTVLGGIIGGFVGEEAVKALSDPVIDGIGNFGRAIGDWFGGLWERAKGLFGKAVEGIVGFFGEEGPIQSTWRFFIDIPNKVGKLISEGWDLVGQALNDVPRLLLMTTLGPLLGPAAGFLVDRLQGRALGGAGRGLTLVGENGPELVNLGSGSVVYPMTSFKGPNREGRGTTINNVTININAPGAELFANELSSIIVDRLDELYEEERALSGSIA